MPKRNHELESRKEPDERPLEQPFPLPSTGAEKKDRRQTMNRARTGNPKAGAGKNPAASFRSAAQKLLAKADKVQRLAKYWSYNLFPSGGGKDVFSGGTPDAGIYAESLPRNLSLHPAQIKTFRREGWIGPFPFLSARGIKAAEKTYYQVHRNFRNMDKPGLEQPDSFREKPWSKSMQAYVREYYDLARHPAIVEKVASLLGPNLMAWGAALNFYRPGERHRWHVDVEHRHWKGVTVFLGLSNITKKSTLKVISRSQGMKKMPQELGVDDDASALAACRKLDKNAQLTAVPLKEGEFFIFDGPLWHGSKNETFRTRGAMILQYSRPDQKVKIPVKLTPPLQWHPAAPSCVMVKGVDRWGVNRMAERP
jgi:hypothetical protein